MNEERRLRDLDLHGLVGADRLAQQGETLGRTSPLRVHVTEMSGDDGGREGDLPVARELAGALEEARALLALSLARLQIAETGACVGDAPGMDDRLGAPARPAAPPQAFGLLEVLAGPSRLSERMQGIAQIETEVDRRFQHLAGPWQARQGLEGLLETGHGFPVGREPSRSGSGVTEVRHRLLPHLTRSVVSSERRIVRLAILGVEMFERLRHQDVQHLTAWLKELVVRHLTNPL